MIKKLLALSFALGSVGAQASLATLSAWENSAQIQSQGLTGVLFNTTTVGSGYVALGAHAYKNGVYLPSDGVSIFEGQSGIYAADGKGRANWSFDFAYNLTGCTGCTVWLRIDTDPSAAASFVETEMSQFNANFINAGGGNIMDSWNMTAPWVNLGFDPYGASSTDFQLVVRDANGRDLQGGSTAITVNVPEPGALALVALALAGLGLSRRRKA